MRDEVDYLHQPCAERRVWFVFDPSIPGAGYRVAGGPIDGRALLAVAPT